MEGDDIEVESLIKYSLIFDENAYLNETLKSIKSHIDSMFTKYDPRIAIKQHPISESMKYNSTEDQLKTRDKEIENAEKQLATILREYE
jgi:hypothetical protein